MISCLSNAALSTAVGLLFLLVGCDATGTNEPGSGDSGSSEDVPIAVDCSFSVDGEQVDVSYEVADEPVETPVGSKLVAGAGLSDSEHEGRSFSLRIYAEDGGVRSTALYQMAKDHLPYNEFYGDHGFTGLHSVKDPVTGEVLQYACFARDPADPPHFWVE